MVLDIIGVVVTLLAVAVGAWFLGGYLVKVFAGERVFLSPVLRPVERSFYWLSGIKEDREQSWIMYAIGMLLFHVGGFLILYVLMRAQAVLPFTGPPPGPSVGPSTTQIAGKNGTEYTVEGPILAKWETLTDDQKKQLDALQKDVDAKLAKILTEDQKKQLKGMREGFGPRGPGGRGPGDRGPGDRGPGGRGPGEPGPGGRGPGDRGPGDRGPGNDRGPGEDR